MKPPSQPLDAAAERDQSLSEPHNTSWLLAGFDRATAHLTSERLDVAKHNAQRLLVMIDEDFRDADMRSWRRAALTFRAGVSARAGEADILIKRRNVRLQEEQTAAARERNGGRSTAELRGEAGEEAVQRLIEAHLDEFIGYFREAKDARRSEAGGRRD